ncbi:MAG: TldD/PmbA family protein [Thermoleophilia bacterium]
MAADFPGLSVELAQGALTRVLRRGGDFAEVFAEDRTSLTLRLEDGKVEEVSSGRDRGVSLRLVRGVTTSFGYSESVDESSLFSLADRLSAGLDGAPSAPVVVRATAGGPLHPVRMPPLDVSTAEKAAMVRAVDEAARAHSPEVRQVIAGYSEGRQRVWVANSRGTYATDDRTRVVLSITVVAQRDGVIQTGRETVAGPGGYEVVTEGDVTAAARSAAEKAVVMLGARPAPTGRMPVILANGFGGVLFHEACGHGLEADFIVKKTSIWEGQLGARVAEPFVTALDDGATPGFWGSNAIDDEGTRTNRTVVIEEGVLVAYLTDLLRGEKLGMASTGNGRRQSFRHLPYPRMTNTYFAPGSVTAEDLVADTRRAFFAKSLAGGQVDPATGDFVFGVSEGYIVENGRIGPPVKGATLIGNGRGVLRAIDAVASDLDIKAGMCGKEGQLVPVGSGQPTIRLRELTVGGTTV